jgi:hypothetical protein
MWKVEMNILTPYNNEHLEFTDSLIYLLYDEQTRNDIYNFYEKYKLNVWLPQYIRFEDHCLQYIVEFEDGLYRIYIKDRVEMWKVENEYE